MIQVVLCARAYRTKNLRLAGEQCICQEPWLELESVILRPCRNPPNKPPWNRGEPEFPDPGPCDRWPFFDTWDPAPLDFWVSLGTGGRP